MSNFVIRPFLTFLYLFLVLVLVRPAVGQTTWYVDDDNCHPGPGTGTLADPFCMVPPAIDIAVNGDEIIVMPGNYVDGGLHQPRTGRPAGGRADRGLPR